MTSIKLSAKRHIRPQGSIRNFPDRDHRQSRAVEDVYRTPNPNRSLDSANWRPARKPPRMIAPKSVDTRKAKGNPATRPAWAEAALPHHAQGQSRLERTWDARSR